METVNGGVVTAPVAAGARAPRRRRIGELMISAGLITDMQLSQALALQAGNGGRVVNQLIALGHLNSHSFVNFLARQPGITSIDLSFYRVSEELTALIPRDFAIERQVFPIDRLGRLLTVGMVCPLDVKTLDDLKHITGLSVKGMLCTAESIRVAIKRHYSDEDDLGPSKPGQHDVQRLQWIR